MVDTVPDQFPPRGSIAGLQNRPRASPVYQRETEIWKDEVMCPKHSGVSN